MKGFEWCAASVQGASHARRGKNNQDSFWVIDTDDKLVAVVADGCGSGEHSEVGSTIGARALAHALTYWPMMPIDEILSTHRERMAGRFKSMAQLAGAYSQKDINEFVGDYCLYTLVGAVMDAERLIIFAFGDGAVGLDGNIKTWDYWRNAPPYIGYDAIDPDNDMEWSIIRNGSIDGVTSFMVGTDGVEDLIKAADKSLPGKPLATVTPVEIMAECDPFFENPDMLRRHLSLAAMSATRLDPETKELDKRAGLLGDDTTLVIVRRERP